MVFTENQLRAIQAEGHLMVSACPGSGKTRVITERAARLLENANNNIALVTFTRAAAEEMQHRVSQRATTDRVTVKTFHAFALMQYKQSPNPGKIASSLVIRNILFRIMNEQRVRDEEGDTYAYSDLKEIIEEFGCLLYPQDIKHENRHKWTVYRVYQQYLKEQGYIDLQGISRQVVLEMRQGRLSPLPVTHLLIDEYQDIDNIQLAWVEEHIKRGIQVTVVADDDQSIYAFRRALGYSGLEQFQQIAKPEQVILDDCFRCPTQVLEHAARLIQHNTRRVAKTLRTHTHKPGAITHVQCLDNTQEGEVVATVLGTTPGSRAVLARKNAELDEIDSALQAHGVDFIRLTGRRFWDSETASLYVALLESLLDTSKSLGIYSVLSYAGADEAKTRAYIESLSAAATAYPLAGDSLSPSIQEFNQSLLRFQSMIGQDWRVAIEWATDYLLALYEDNENSYSYRKHRHVLELARDTILKAVTRTGADGVDGLSQVLSNIHREAARSQELELDQDKLLLLTMHGAKGLEFDVVWIVRANAQDTDEVSQVEIEEERRLFYVAMTRTKQRLYISSREDTGPSRFLIEAGLIQQPEQNHHLIEEKA